MIAPNKTSIFIWVFANEVEIINNDDHYWDIKEAQAWALINTWHTAVVMRVVQYWPGGELVIHNENYKPFEPGSRDLSHLKNDKSK